MHKLVLFSGDWYGSSYGRGLFCHRMDKDSRPAIKGRDGSKTVWVLRNDIHQWLVDREITYRLFFDFVRIKSGEVRVWIEMQKDQRVLFKLTWGGECAI